MVVALVAMLLTLIHRMTSYRHDNIMKHFTQAFLHLTKKRMRAAIQIEFLSRFLFE